MCEHLHAAAIHTCRLDRIHTADIYCPYINRERDAFSGQSRDGMDGHTVLSFVGSRVPMYVVKVIN